MGQQNDKIYFEDINQPQQLRKNRKIFVRNYQTKQKHIPNKCDRPNCTCPSQHVKVNNLKLCSTCNDPKAPTIWKNKKYQYQSAPPRTNRQPSMQYVYTTAYKQANVLQKQQPVYYYNGWGLPTQKCYVDGFIRDIPANIEIPPQQPQVQIRSPYQKPTYNPPQYIQIPKPEPKSPSPVRPVLHLDQVNINDRVQNLFLF